MIAGLDSDAIFDPELNALDKDPFDWVNANRDNLADYGLGSDDHGKFRYVFAMPDDDGMDAAMPSENADPLALDMASPEDVISDTPPQAQSGGLTLNGGTPPPSPVIPTRSAANLGITLRPLSPNSQQPSISTFRQTLRNA